MNEDKQVSGDAGPSWARPGLIWLRPTRNRNQPTEAPAPRVIRIDLVVSLRDSKPLFSSERESNKEVTNL